MEHANELVLLQTLEAATLAVMTFEANSSKSATPRFSLRWSDNHIVTLRGILQMKLPRLRIPTLHTENLVSRSGDMVFFETD